MPGAARSGSPAVGPSDRPTAAVRPFVRAMADGRSTVPGAGQVGYVLSHEQFPTDHPVTFARAAEVDGYQSMWASDHWQPNP